MQDHSYAAFRKHYEKYMKKIYAYLYYRSGRDKERAEDLTSEVFLKALEKFNSFNPENSSFGAWIYAIARNHLIDHYRVSKPHLSLDEVHENLLAQTIDIGAHIDKKDELKKVVAVIQTLPENYREILTLKYLNGFENDEIEEIIDKSQTNIRVLIHRAIAALKKKLESPAT